MPSNRFIRRRPPKPRKCLWRTLQRAAANFSSPSSLHQEQLHPSGATPHLTTKEPCSSFLPQVTGINSCKGNRMKDYLLVSDFDQTLSFNDSGLVLSELLGVSNFSERISGLSHIHLVQQGGELTYLLLHDPEFRRVRKEHLIEVGKRIRLKQNIRLLSELLQDIDGHRFSFYVVSAAPQEVIQSALEGIVPQDHIFGTQFRYDAGSGEIESIVHVPAGYGKVAVLDQLRSSLP